MAATSSGALAKCVRIIADSFQEQKEVLNDKSPKICIWTTRRAGKTRTVLNAIVVDALIHPYSKYIYIGLTLASVEEIVWAELKRINREYSLGIKFHNTKLIAKFPNGSRLRLYGVNKPDFLDKLYGQKMRKIAIDEAAFYSISVYDMIEDHLEPCTIDYNGQIYIMSIPGKIPRGLFWDVTKNFSYKEKFSGRQSETVPGWSCYRWTTKNNPHTRKQFCAKIDQKKKENPDVENDPKFIRNYLGAWVTELGERVYRFDEVRNGIDDYKLRKGDKYILGIDFGWDDKTAFSLCVWREDSPLFVELESFSKSEMLLDEIADHTKGYMDSYPDLTIVADPAHKQLFEQFRRRYKLPVVEGEKPKKDDWIRTINSDLAAGKIKILNQAESSHADEMVRLTWKVTNTGFRKEMPGQPNDICDAFMYAYRLAYHFRYEPEIEQPKKGTKEYWDKVENEIIERLEDEANEPEDDWDEA